MNGRHRTIRVMGPLLNVVRKRSPYNFIDYSYCYKLKIYEAELFPIESTFFPSFSLSSERVE